MRKLTNKTEAAQGRRLQRSVRPLSGLQRICKLFGRMKCGDVMVAWDYANECAVPEKELRADKSRWAASEKAKWSNVKISEVAGRKE